MLAAALVLTVVGAMKHDLRWLLIGAWPLAVFGISTMAKTAGRWRWLLTTIFAIVIAAGLLALNHWLKPKLGEATISPSGEVARAC